MSNNNEIDLYSKITSPIDAIDKMGEWFAKSGMFGCDRREQGNILAATCIAERKSPMQIAREYHIIEGRLSDRADALLAKFLQEGGKREGMVKTTDKASITLTAKDGNKMTFTESWEEIQKEPFVWSKTPNVPKKNWATPRARMQTLWARVISEAVRTMAPEIACGIQTPEEIQDEVQPSAPLDLTVPIKQAVEFVADVPLSTPVSVPVAVTVPEPKAVEVVAMIPPETPYVEKVAALCMGNLLAAAKWFQREGYMPKGVELTDENAMEYIDANLGSVREKTLQNIVNRSEAWLRAIKV